MTKLVFKLQHHFIKNILSKNPSGVVRNGQQKLHFFKLLLLLLIIYSTTLYASPVKSTGQLWIDISDFKVAFSLDLGQDDGASLGTIFEVRDQAGNIIAGAGFERSFNTMAGSNHRLISFFTQREGTSTLHDLGRPFGEHSSIRLFSYAGKLIAYPRDEEVHPRQFDAESNIWKPADLTELASGKYGYVKAIQAAYDTLLVFHTQAVTFDGKPIIINDLAADDEIVTGLFHNGLLNIFVRNNLSGRTSSFLICPWRGGKKADACQVIRMPDGRVSPFVLHGLRNNKGIIAAFNNGDVLLLNSGHVSIVHKNSISGGQALKSWQLYSAIEVQDDIVFGHYPSGNLLLYRDDVFSPIDPPVPFVRGSLADAREAQTLAIFRGKLMIGMWPWGELWSGLPGAPWRLEARIFHKPDYTKERAPYADLLGKRMPNIAYNALGQRIFHFHNYAEGLALTTSGKNPKIAHAYTAIGPSERIQYGRVLLLKSPDQLTCGLSGPYPQKITFESKGGYLRISGAKGVLCERRLGGAPPITKTGQFVPLKGLWGPASSKIHLAK